MANHNLPSFSRLLQAQTGEKFLRRSFDKQFTDNRSSLFGRWYQETGEAGEIYPSQGLLLTPYDHLEFLGKVLLKDEDLWKTLRMRHYILNIFNHPNRLEQISIIEKSPFTPPPTVESTLMANAIQANMAFSGWDLQLAVTGTDTKRVARRQLLQTGPFLKIGKFGRIPFSGGAMPDIFGAPAALATMCMCHGLANIPRNGVFSSAQRQAELAQAAINWMHNEPLLTSRPDQKQLLERWQHNLVGVIEPNPKTALERAKLLYEAGVRTFRIYSPEPGVDAIKTLDALRNYFPQPIEIFVGQVASIEQAQAVEAQGADGVYVGIGGGGRCTTAVRSASAVDWPMLIWQLRGQIGIPVVVEGGASEHIGLTLALGGSAIGISRSAGGGTIESPGGLLYLINQDKQWFKPYGGEASARTKYQDGKMLACDLPAFVEGETTCAYKSYIPHILPTMAQSIFFLMEDLILSLVFRGVKTIGELHKINPSPIRQVTQSGNFQAGTH